MPPLIPQDFQRWKLELRDVCGQFDARRSAADHHFYGSAERLEFGDLEIARIQSNAASIARARHHNSQADLYCFLVLQVQGHQHLSVDRLEPVNMQPGDLMLLDPGSPFEMLPHGFVENLSVHLPRSFVKAQIPGRHITGKLDGDVVSVQVLGALIRQLAAAVPGYTASNAEAHALRQAIVSLLSPALRHAEADRDAAGLYLAAVAQADANLASFDLTPDWLADRLQVSRRQLYRAFAAEGHPGVAQFILGRRLDRAADLLRNASRSAQPVGVIAVEAGLADLAHFSRSFRKRFALSPSQFRAVDHD
jgi:AraC-like DNA-binding protein